MIDPPAAVPDLVFAGGDGAPVRLSEWRGRPVVLIFLRWLG
jgi:peroxiredoxin